MHFILFQTSSLKSKNKRTTYIKQSASVPTSIRNRGLGTALEPARSPALTGLRLSLENTQPKKERKRNECLNLTLKLHFPRDFLQKELRNCPVLTLSKFYNCPHHLLCDLICPQSLPSSCQHYLPS